MRCMCWEQTCQLCFDNLLELGHGFAGEWAIFGL